MTTQLAARDIDFAYVPGTPVLTKASASVQAGSVLGLVGPNGAGKSTLLRVLAGLVDPAHGEVRINDSSIRTLSPSERARLIGFLPQNISPACSLPVFEIVCLGRHPHLTWTGSLSPHDREIALRCMRDTGTDHLKNRELSTLSGGERQRVLLASVLAQEPRILLLDEPASALDLHHQVELFTLLRKLAANDYAICVVTHDLTLAARFCDRLVLLDDAAGSVLAEGAPVDVLTEAILSKAYHAPVRVCPHPITGTPLVTVDTQDATQQ